MEVQTACKPDWLSTDAIYLEDGIIVHKMKDPLRMRSFQRAIISADCKRVPSVRGYDFLPVSRLQRK
jgi:hypothetical protein